MDNLLCLVEGKGRAARLGWQRTLVHEVSDRLCAWESALAIEAKASKARCTTCYGHDLSPVMRTNGSAQSEVVVLSMLKVQAMGGPCSRLH